MMVAPQSLGDLVAPLDENAFMDVLRRRELVLLRGTQPDRFESLLSWRTLLAMIERGDHPHSLVEFYLSHESAMVPPERWLSPDPVQGGNKVDVAKVVGFVSQGVSLVIHPVDRYVPALSALCDALRARLGEQIKAGVIVTRGQSGAFKLHYDPEDLIILQVEGSKRWRIYGPPVENPVAGMPPTAPPAEQSPIFDNVLNAGDLLFVPAGNWHHCIGGTGRSLHLTIFITPPTAWHAIRNLTSGLVSDALFLKPVTRLESERERDALRTAIKERAIALIDALDLDRFVANWAEQKN